MKTNPCEGCKDRHIGCHGRCLSYNIYIATLHKQKDKIKNAKSSDQIFYDYKSVVNMRIDRISK